MSDIVNKFKHAVAMELDLEPVLRTYLELVLSHTGPTNAAVFLPATSGDWTLGAYVNYNLANEAVEVIFDHIANAAVDRHFLKLPSGTISVIEDEAITPVTGEVPALSCIGRHQGEDMLVLVLFDASRPYTPAQARDLDALSQEMASHLGKIVRIHHRALPAGKGKGLGDMTEEQEDSDPWPTP